MDRHPQQIKRERQDKKRRSKNVAHMSKLKTSIKKILSMSKLTPQFGKDRIPDVINSSE